MTTQSIRNGDHIERQIIQRTIEKARSRDAKQGRARWVLKWLLALVLLGILGAAATAQAIALPYTAGSTLPPNFRAVPHESGVFIVNDGPAVQVPVTMYGLPVLAAKNVGGVRGPWWLQGEALLAAPWAPEPDDAKRAAIRGLLASSLDWDLLESPRVAAVLANFSDRTPHDYGYTCRRDVRKNWLGETIPPGDQAHYDAMNPVGAEGWNNAHYDLDFWAWVNWLTTGDDLAYSAALRWSIAKVTSGFVWSGPGRGMYRYEKGYDYVGSAFAPAWEKNWCRGTVLAWHVTGMPIFRLAIEAHREALRALPATWWAGEWGARIPGRILDDMLVLQEGMGYGMAARAIPFVRHVVSLADPDLDIWRNLGNGGTAPASPWMNGECWQDCWYWASREPALYDVRPRLLEIGRAILQRGIVRIGGRPFCLYRFHPVNEPPIALGHLGFLLPVARVCDPALAEEIRTMLKSYSGALLSQIPGAVPAISDIRCDYGPKGPAGYKDMLEILHGARLR